MKNQTVRLSKSQIIMHMHCARQWAFRYVEGLKMRPSGAMKLGNVFHETIARNYKQKAESQKDLPLDEQKDYFVDALKLGLESEEVQFDEGETADTLKDTGVGIVAAHHRDIAPKVFPESEATVEERIELNIGKDESAFGLIAILDITDRDGVIRENKSMGKRPNQFDVDKNIDLSIYALAKRLQTKKVEPKLAMDVALKLKQPSAITLETTRSRDALRFSLNQIGHIARSIRAEAFPPNTDWWGCHPKYCGYFSICVGKGLKTVDMGQNLEAQLKESVRREEKGEQGKEGGNHHPAQGRQEAGPKEGLAVNGDAVRAKGTTRRLFD